MVEELHINMHIGIDVGGTKTESIIIDANGKEIERVRKDTPKNYTGTIDIVCELVNYLEDKYKKNVVLVLDLQALYQKRRTVLREEILLGLMTDP